VCAGESRRLIKVDAEEHEKGVLEGLTLFQNSRNPE
jgi:hypothetical protein